MSIYLTEAKLIRCPFDYNHKVSESRYQMHIAACAKNLKNRLEFVQCKYNSSHYLRKGELELHYRSCPDFLLCVQEVKNYAYRGIESPLIQRQPLPQPQHHTPLPEQPTFQLEPTVRAAQSTDLPALLPTPLQPTPLQPTPPPPPTERHWSPTPLLQDPTSLPVNQQVSTETYLGCLPEPGLGMDDGEGRRHYSLHKSKTVKFLLDDDDDDDYHNGCENLTILDQEVEKVDEHRSNMVLQPILERHHDPILKQQTFERHHDPILKQQTVEHHHAPILKQQTVEHHHAPIMKQQTVEHHHDPILAQPTFVLHHDPIRAQPTFVPHHDPILEQPPSHCLPSSSSSRPLHQWSPSPTRFSGPTFGHLQYQHRGAPESAFQPPEPTASPAATTYPSTDLPGPASIVGTIINPSFSLLKPVDWTKLKCFSTFEPLTKFQLQTLTKGERRRYHDLLLKWQKRRNQEEDKYTNSSSSSRGGVVVVEQRGHEDYRRY